MPDNYEIVYQGRNMDMTSGGVYTEYLMASDAETTDLPTDGRPGSIAYNPTTGDLYMMDMSKSWNAVGSGGGGGSNPTIPTPTAEDNGKFLGVSNGEYALANAGGSNAPLICTDTEGTLDKTWQEVVDASASRIVVVRVSNSFYYLIGYRSVRGYTAEFKGSEQHFYSANSANDYLTLET